LCNWSDSHKKIRELCYELALPVAQWEREYPQSHRPYREAQGDVGFSTEGIMFYITDVARNAPKDFRQTATLRTGNPPGMEDAHRTGDDRAYRAGGDGDQRTVRLSMGTAD
jgi:hypothetical protein